MLRTVTIGSCVSVQGQFVRAFPDGRIEVKLDNKTIVGRPAEPVRAA